ncbi:hypothetical protein T2_00026 [Ralstonia phage Elie]|uniref:DUF2213 domain-containing protein n=2 Tax=Bakolyvirus simangalove TaxID=2846051 RepID=A0A7G5BBQ5_9CAUD|nr:head maturation protease [Ralstonia phage Adzire]YP_010077713.1 head maturation protease [Ralstonia phage Simangalove]QMV32971.1 hypothetical protein T2_00026 [Ralstonia phage Elie]QMV33683.1 hypothetical protein S3_00039 [Ralstonia phage Sarlave]QMV32343.1 hypothetical protein S1_00026 [Ralstonia phage Adzire]QMV33728.1 hypothetical protein R1_00026 [Ralstonia phage Simangalove]
MRVRDCILSTAEVNPYRGAEIPGWDKLGLNPDRVYNLYRDPAELERAVASFDGVPLLARHVVSTADDPQRDAIVGTITNPRMDGKHLRGDLLVLDARAIDWIETDTLRDLSCGYRYDPVMKSGDADGVHYDGVMRAIHGNHVALVKDGRATDAHVADAALPNAPQSPDTRKEQQMALENEREPRAEAEPGSPAGEANEQANMAAVGQALKQIATILQDIHGKVMGGAAPADTAAVDNKEDGEEGEKPKGAEDEGEKPKGAEDEGGGGEQGVAQPEKQEEGLTPGESSGEVALDAKLKALVDKAVRAESARKDAIYAAREETRSILGAAVMSMDSAGEIYREALTHAGVDMADVPKGQEKTAWVAFKSARRNARNAAEGRAVTHAGDSGASAAGNKIAGLLGNIRVLG